MIVKIIFANKRDLLFTLEFVLFYFSNFIQIIQTLRLKLK